MLMEQKKENRIVVTDIVGTPYDDVFRTLLERCEKLIIPVINEVFKTDYCMDEEITLISNEHYIVESDGKSVKRVTDSCIKIRNRLYHIECESNPKTGIEIRMIEYDFHIALCNWEREDDRAVLRFPDSAVLFLRHSSNSPDKLKVKLIMPDGGEANYTVPVVKVQNYTKEEIFNKNLLFFIPYYILRFEQRMKEIDKEEAEVQKLVDDYKDIYNRLLGLEALEQIDYNYLYDLIALTSRLIEVVARDSDNIKREVTLMGGGKVLEMESEKIHSDGISQGMSQGISQGIASSIITVLKRIGQVTDELATCIMNETNADILNNWLDLALNVSSIDEFIEKK